MPLLDDLFAQVLNLNESLKNVDNLGPDLARFVFVWWCHSIVPLIRYILLLVGLTPCKLILSVIA